MDRERVCFGIEARGLDASEAISVRIYREGAPSKERLVWRCSPRKARARIEKLHRVLKLSDADVAQIIRSAKAAG